MNEAILAGPDTLLERELEVERVRGALRAAGRREGVVVVIDGPAGIGKSRLLEIARSRAADLGFCVVSARATELEQGFPFGVVGQQDLAANAAPQLVDVDPFRQRRAADGLLGVGHSGPPKLDELFEDRMLGPAGIPRIGHTP